MVSFSTRYGYKSPKSEIKIRHDAPDNLRWEIVIAFYEAPIKAFGEGTQKKEPSALRNIVCSVLRKRPDASNWSEYPNIDGEVQSLIDQCDWYCVYDIIEAICVSLNSPEQEAFSTTLNEFFQEESIGWQIRDGKVEYRDEEEFEELTQAAILSLTTSGRTTAKQELQEALKDLSRRPVPDTTGAIQHAMASLECLMRDTRNSKATLGGLLKEFPGLIPKPLDIAVEKAWAYASERGRHLLEGKDPSLEEAELIVHICAVLISYLSKKVKN